MSKRSPIIIGKKYGKLTVLRPSGVHTYPSGRKLTQYRCKCDCGKTKDIVGVMLTRALKGGPGVKSCGCIIKAPIGPPKIGQKFTRLTVLKETAIEIQCGGATKIRRFQCRCSCGKTIITRMTTLNAGKAKSCGCLHKEIVKARASTHSMSKTSFYKAWSHMLERTNNSNTKCWHNYGGRGIKTCKRWEIFENFRDDMYSTYKSGLEIDRIDNSGDYTPKNCHWTTPKRNNRNKRTNVVFAGKCMMEWSEELKVNYSTLRGRRRRLGSLDKAVKYSLSRV